MKNAKNGAEHIELLHKQCNVHIEKLPCMNYNKHITKHKQNRFCNGAGQ